MLEYAVSVIDPIKLTLEIALEMAHKAHANLGSTRFVMMYSLT